MKGLTKIILGIMFLLVTVNSPLLTLNAAIPNLINYQGRLTDASGKPLEGSHSLTFRIYDAETAGTLLWEETHSGALIQKGIFSVLLGGVTNLDLPFDKSYWLEIKIGNEVLSPRQRFNSTGYAYRAKFSDNGFPKGAIIPWSGSIASIPQGWALCDGNNGTPDLRGRFIIGARAETLNQTGGQSEVTLTTDTMPSHRHYSEHKHTVGTHTHTLTAHQHTQTAHTHPIGSEGWDSTKGYIVGRWRTDLGSEKTVGIGGGGILTGSAGDTQTSSASGQTSSFAEHYTSFEGSGSAITNLPPYYALALIMKL